MLVYLAEQNRKDFGLTQESLRIFLWNSMGISFKSIQSVLSHHASFLALSFGRIRRERTGWPTVRGLWKVVRSERTSTDARRHQRGELEDAFPLFL